MLNYITRHLSLTVFSTFVLAACIGADTPVASAQTYKIKNLGALCSCYTEVSAINNLGQVVGKVGHDWAVNNTAFRTAPNSALNPATDYLPGGWSSTRAYSINDQGHVVGVSPGNIGIYDPIIDSSGIIRALFWDTSGGMFVLDLSAARSVYLNSAVGINNNLQIVGIGYDTQSSPSFRLAYLMNPPIPSPPNFLGTFPGGSHSEARAINDNGRIVGFAKNSAGYFRAFISNGGPLQDLGTLGGPACASCESFAYSINNSSSFYNVVGKSNISYVLGTRAATHAFLRYQSRVGPALQDLGTLDGPGCPTRCESAAYDINDLGQIVGESEITSSSDFTHAFVRSSGVMKDLNDHIPAAAQLLWILTDARGVNDLGQIVGTGLFEGEMRGYLLTPAPIVLAASIDDLIVVFQLDRAVESVLRARVGAIRQAIRDERGAAACTEASAFAGEVRTQTGRGLTQIQATKLLAGADLMRTELECR